MRGGALYRGRADAHGRALPVQDMPEGIGQRGQHLYGRGRNDVPLHEKGEPLAHCSGGNAYAVVLCGTCGVHLTAQSPRAPGGVIVKVGTLDEPGLFKGPQLTVWTSEMQAFHQLPPDVPAHRISEAAF